MFVSVVGSLPSERMDLDATAETVPIDSLYFHPANPRQGDIGAISESLAANGLFRPIVVSENTMHVLDGNHTLQAAAAEGRTDIPVWMIHGTIDPSGDVHPLTADQELRILTAANRTADRAGYAYDSLHDVLVALHDTPTGLYGTGFDDEDLDDIARVVAGLGGDGTDPYAEWEGMPDFDQPGTGPAFKTTVQFLTNDDADQFFEMLGRDRKASIWWPAGDGHKGWDSTRRWEPDDDE